MGRAARARPAAGTRIDVQAPVQPRALARACSADRGRLRAARRRQSLAVVRHLQHEPVALDPDVDVGVAALGVARDIVDGFLEDEEDFAPHVGGQRQSRPASGARKVKSMSLPVNVSLAKWRIRWSRSPTRSRFWIDGPDDVAHGLDELTRGGRDAAERVRGRRPGVGLAARQLAQDGNLREAGPDVVVEIGGNPRADTLDRHELRDAVPIEQRHEPDDERGRDGEEPPTLPDRRQDAEADARRRGGGGARQRHGADQETIRTR